MVYVGPQGSGMPLQGTLDWDPCNPDPRDPGPWTSLQGPGDPGPKGICCKSRGAKIICYGLIYGIGTARLAIDLGVSRMQAQEFQSSFMHQGEIFKGALQRIARPCSAYTHKPIKLCVILCFCFG